MHARDSQGGKARDAQIIRGRLERAALSHAGPEIPVPRVRGTGGGGGTWELGEVYPAPRGAGQNLGGGCSWNLQQGPAAAIAGKARGEALRSVSLTVLVLAVDVSPICEQYSQTLCQAFGGRQMKPATDKAEREKDEGSGR